MAAAAHIQPRITLSVDLIRSYSEDLVHRANGSQLRASLSAGELLTAELADVKWYNVLIARDAFLNTLSVALDTEGESDRAVLALSHLTTTYLHEFGFRPEAVQRLFASRDALERADLVTARRELKYAANKGDFLRKHSAAILFFLCSTDAAREAACRLLPAKDLRRSRGSSMLLPPEPVVPQVSKPQPQPDGKPDTEDVHSQFLMELAEVISPPVQRTVSWGLEELLHAKQIRDVPVLEFDGGKLLTDAITFLQTVRTEVTDLSDSPAHVIGILARFEDWATAAGSLRSSVHSRIEQMKTFIRASLLGLPSTYSEATQAVAAMLDTDAEIGRARDLYNELATRYKAEQHAEIRRVATMAAEIERLAIELRQPDAERLAAIVQGLVRDFRTVALERLHQSTMREVNRLRGLRQRQTQALELARLKVSEFSIAELDTKTQEALRKAVADGDPVAVESIVAARRAYAASGAARSIGAVDVLPSAATQQQDASATVDPLSKVDHLTDTPTDLPDGIPDAGLEDIAVPLQPRDVETEAVGLPLNARAAARTLLARSVSQVKRGSVIGALDNLLDLLSLTTKCKSDSEYPLWSTIAVLSCIPADAGIEDDWADQCYADICDILRSRTVDLVRPIRNLLAYDQFDDALQARFTYDDFHPFADQLGAALYTAAVRAPGDKLLDVASAVGRGTLANPRLGVALLSTMARTAGLSVDTAGLLTDLRPRGTSRRRAAQPPDVPDWLWAGIEPLASDREPVKTSNLAALNLANVRVQLIPTLQARGVPFDVRTGRIDLALYVSTLSDAPLAAAELTISPANNPWLLREVIFPINGVERNNPVVVPLHLDTQGVSTSSTIRLEYKLRIKTQARPCRTRLLTGSVPVLVSDGSAVEIKGYDGAAGLPLRLVGDDLRYSSASVRAALSELRERLAGGPYYARLVGRRRRGKTSILYTLRDDGDLQARYTIVYYAVQSGQAGGIDDTLTEIGAMLDKAARRLNLELEPMEERLKGAARPWSVVDEWLETAESCLDAPVSVLLLVDEFQKLLSQLSTPERNTVLALYRGLKDRPRNSRLSFSIVLSGLTSILRYSDACKDFEVGFPVLAVETFSDHEVTTLLRSNTSIDFDARAIFALRELAGGNPFLVNLLGDRVASQLRECKRSYCLPTDVEIAVEEELQNRQRSTVWKYLEYLLREGEEDQAPDIQELPAIEALAWALSKRGSRRQAMHIDELLRYLEAAGLSCDRRRLEQMLNEACSNELLVNIGRAYRFASGWVGRWLSAAAPEIPKPIDPVPDPNIVLRRYRLTRLLASGTRSYVHLAEDMDCCDRQVVLKIYPRTDGAMRPAVTGTEVRALRLVDHPCVVECTNEGVDPLKGDVIVLEYVRGTTLRDWITKRPSLLIGPSAPLPVQIKFIEQLADALCECHRRGVVHKDLKPENIIVTELTGVVSPKIIDFGLAAETTPTTLIQPTDGPYTIGYVAPEKLRGVSRQAPSDIFSLGVIAAEILTGFLPACGTAGYREEDLREHLTTHRAGLGAVKDLLCRMVSASPDDRPPAALVRAQLPELLKEPDWTALYRQGEDEYYAGEYRTAMSLFRSAVLIAPPSSHGSREFNDAARNLIYLAGEERQAFAELQPILSIILDAIVRRQKDGSLEDPLLNAFRTALFETVPGIGEESSQHSVFADLIEWLLTRDVHVNLNPLIVALLEHSGSRALTRQLTQLYEVAWHYTLENLLPRQLLMGWCISTAEKCSRASASIAEARLWLQRAAVLGAKSSVEYCAVDEEVRRFERAGSTTEVSLPNAEQQERPEKFVSNAEPGHLNCDRMTKWAQRLYTRYPFVQDVRRVQKDRGIPPRPTRLLVR